MISKEHLVPARVLVLGKHYDIEKQNKMGIGREHEEPGHSHTYSINLNKRMLAI